jgi:hypothetical protein
MASRSPGRACPLSYRYDIRVFSENPVLDVETLWVAGGLYGNPFALERLVELYAREPGSKALVFNGDFHWFDVEPEQFSLVDKVVAEYLATRGNVETELASPEADAGCGCGYPEWVDDETVARSNRIIERLRRTARRFPAALERLAGLSMHCVAAVGGERVAVVHGDAESLAGWGFSQEALATRPGRDAAARWLDASGIGVFASSHSCLPVLQSFAGERVIVNNGAAGMPNFQGTRYGLATRISVSPSKEAIYGAKAKRLVVEAVPLEYDAQAWEKRFLAQWPEGSDAHSSYFGRIASGPRYGVERALRRLPALAA